MWDYVKHWISMYVCTNVDIEIHMHDHLHTFNSSLSFFDVVYRPDSGLPGFFTTT